MEAPSLQQQQQQQKSTKPLMPPSQSVPPPPQPKQTISSIKFPIITTAKVTPSSTTTTTAAVVGGTLQDKANFAQMKVQQQQPQPRISINSGITNNNTAFLLQNHIRTQKMKQAPQTKAVQSLSKSQEAAKTLVELKTIVGSPVTQPQRPQPQQKLQYLQGLHQQQQQQQQHSTPTPPPTSSSSPSHSHSPQVQQQQQQQHHQTTSTQSQKPVPFSMLLQQQQSKTNANSLPQGFGRQPHKIQLQQPQQVSSQKMLMNNNNSFFPSPTLSHQQIHNQPQNPSTGTGKLGSPTLAPTVGTSTPIINSTNPTSQQQQQQQAASSTPLINRHSQNPTTTTTTTTTTPGGSTSTGTVNTKSHFQSLTSPISTGSTIKPFQKLIKKLTPKIQMPKTITTPTQGPAAAAAGQPAPSPTMSSASATGTPKSLAPAATAATLRTHIGSPKMSIGSPLMTIGSPTTIKPITMTNVFNSPTLRATQAAAPPAIGILSPIMGTSAPPPNGSNAILGNNNSSSATTTTIAGSAGGMGMAGPGAAGGIGLIINNGAGSGSNGNNSNGGRILTIPVKQTINISNLINAVPQQKSQQLPQAQSQQPQPQPSQQNQQQPNLIGTIIKNASISSPTFGATTHIQPQPQQQQTVYTGGTIVPSMGGTVKMSSPTMVPTAVPTAGGGDKGQGKSSKKDRKTKGKGKLPGMQQHDPERLEKIQNRQIQLIQQKLKQDVSLDSPTMQPPQPPKPVTLGSDIINTDMGYNIFQPSVLGDLGFRTAIAPPILQPQPSQQQQVPSQQPQPSQISQQQPPQPFILTQQVHRHKHHKAGTGSTSTSTTNASSSGPARSSSGGAAATTSNGGGAQDGSMGMMDGSSVPTVLVNPSATISGDVSGGSGVKKERKSPTMSATGRAEDADRMIAPKPIRVFTAADANTQIQAKKRKKREKKTAEEKQQQQQGESAGDDSERAKLTNSEDDASQLLATKFSNAATAAASSQRAVSPQHTVLKRPLTPNRLMLRTSPGLSQSLLLMRRRKKKRMQLMQAANSAAPSATAAMASGMAGGATATAAGAAGALLPAKKRRKKLTSSQGSAASTSAQSSAAQSGAAQSSSLVFKEFESHMERNEENEVKIVHDRDITPSPEMMGSIEKHEMCGIVKREEEKEEEGRVEEDEKEKTKMRLNKIKREDENEDIQNTSNETTQPSELTSLPSSTLETKTETTTSKSHNQSQQQQLNIKNEDIKMEMDENDNNNERESEYGEIEAIERKDEDITLNDKEEIINPEESVPPPTKYYESFGDDTLDDDDDDEDEDNNNDGDDDEEEDYNNNDGDSMDASEDGIIVRDYVPNVEADVIEHVFGHRVRNGAGQGSTIVDLEGPGVEFNIKWKGWAAIHNTWNTMRYLERFKGVKRVWAYIKTAQAEAQRRRGGSAEEIEQLDIQREMSQSLFADYTQAERIVAERRVHGAGTYYLVQWKSLPYSECTWERAADVARFPAEIAAFRARNARYLRAGRPAAAAAEGPLFGPLAASPASLRGGVLRDYQLEGLNWLLKRHERGANGILADEMGLGKTVQVVALVQHLVEKCGAFSPYLVVVPLSTLGQWAGEFKQWAPEVNVVSYVGNAASRAVIRDYEFYGEGARFKLSVVLTTYEIVLKDKPILDQISWEYVVVDEAHRLKNSESHLYNVLIAFKARHRLLLTGTPLQSSVRELWSLLHFVAPAAFPSLPAFERKYAGLQASDGKIRALQAELRPHILRRMRRDVEGSLPQEARSAQATELVLRVAPAPLQRMYYRWVIARNFHEINIGRRGEGKVTLLNIVAELKKVCNHPYLFPGAESAAEADVLRALVRNSGKMRLLDALLTKLRAGGHRVLIFSQMVRMLDVLSDYLRMKAWPFQRLDGSTNRDIRQKAMDHFNAENSQDFVFLLSTRAGGLGINLASADTVIVFDSDWNPQNDVLAQARCRTIGQEKHVTIYRILISGSVEENIVKAAKKKLLLDRLAIQSMSKRAAAAAAANGNSSNNNSANDGDSQSSSNFTDWIIGGMSNSSGEYSKEELDAIIKLGATEMFDITKDKEIDEHIDREIDDILRIIDNMYKSQPPKTSSGPGDDSKANASNVKPISSPNVVDGSIFGLDEKESKPSYSSSSSSSSSLEHSATSSGNASDSEKFISFGNDKFWVDLITTNSAVQKEYNRIQELTKKTQESGRLQVHNAGDILTSEQKYSSSQQQSLQSQQHSQQPTQPTQPKQSTQQPPHKEGASGNAKDNIYKYLINGVKKFGETFGTRMKSRCSSEEEYRQDSEKLAEVIRCCEKNCANRTPVDFHGACQVNFSDLFVPIQIFRTLKELRAKGYSQDAVPELEPPTQAEWEDTPQSVIDTWTPKCDAMILKGVYRHGIGYWNRIAGDKSLGLQKFPTQLIKKRFERLARKLLQSHKRKSSSSSSLLTSTQSSSSALSSSLSSSSSSSSSSVQLSAPVPKKQKLSGYFREEEREEEDRGVKHEEKDAGNGDDSEEDIYEDVMLANAKTPVPPSISPNLSKTPVPQRPQPSASKTPVPPSISPNLSKTPVPPSTSPSGNHQEKQQEKLMLKQKKKQEFNEAKAKIGNALPDEWNIFWKVPPEGEEDPQVSESLLENETKTRCNKLLQSVQADMSKLVYFKIYSCRNKIDFVISKTIKYIRAIGACIDKAVADGSAAGNRVSETQLWAFVAINTTRNSTFVRNLYRRTKSQTSHADIPNALFKSLNNLIIKD